MSQVFLPPLRLRLHRLRRALQSRVRVGSRSSVDRQRWTLPTLSVIWQHYSVSLIITSFNNFHAHYLPVPPNYIIGSVAVESRKTSQILLIAIEPLSLRLPLPVAVPVGSPSLAGFGLAVQVSRTPGARLATAVSGLDFASGGVKVV